MGSLLQLCSRSIPRSVQSHYLSALTLYVRKRLSYLLPFVSKFLSSLGELVVESITLFSQGVQLSVDDRLCGDLTSRSNRRWGAWHRWGMWLGSEPKTLKMETSDVL
ncbi:hypothetical protein CDL15_Pgr026201 [Punica granatum]|uniref:Uncharacterized protein n=1 Tax=Punica granatum TaxID=22663 RepID=A0A218VR67_PUNGR|nr:hypothetical protein CDL15_Pgr026201 [Punica granatum]PKI52598.1 hypothetical protein CRG98_027026 [Punica granatum]